MVLSLHMHTGAHAHTHTPTTHIATVCCRTASLRTDYGMPSNHSEFILFFSTYAALVVLFRYRVCAIDWVHLQLLCEC